MTSFSMSVTSAPRRAAWVAAVLPAGPPPMITNRMATRPGYRPAPSAPVATIALGGAPAGTHTGNVGRRADRLGRSDRGQACGRGRWDLACAVRLRARQLRRSLGLLEP